MIQVRLAELLDKRGKTYYRLSQESGVAHQLFLRLLKGRTSSINFRALEAICKGLDCTPSDLLLVIPDDEKSGEQLAVAPQND